VENIYWQDAAENYIMATKSTVYGDVTSCSLIGHETFRRNILPPSEGQKLNHDVSQQSRLISVLYRGKKLNKFSIQCSQGFRISISFRKIPRHRLFIRLLRATRRWRWVGSNGGMILTGGNHFKEKSNRN